MSTHHEMHVTFGGFVAFEASEVTGKARFVNPSALTEDEFRALLQEIRDGLQEIRARWLVFTDQPNENLRRPAPKELRKIAKSMAGVPFLYDHSVYSVESRRGTVLAGGVKRIEGVDGLVIDCAITEEKAQEAYLRRLVDRFSIHYAAASASCSVCGVEVPEDYYSYGGKLPCGHVLGDTESGILCETWHRGCTAVEVSATNRPADKHTRILSEGKEMGVRSEARITALQAEHATALSAAQAALAAAQAEHATALAAAVAAVKEEHAEKEFEALFEAEVRAGRAFPKHKDSMHALFKASGLQPVRELLSALPTRIVEGSTFSAPEESESAREAVIRRAVRLGKISEADAQRMLAK